MPDSLSFPFLAVLVLTLASGSAATWLAVRAPARPGSLRRLVVERLVAVMLMGAVALVAMLDRFTGLHGG